MATLGLTAMDHNDPCGRTENLRWAACCRNRSISLSEAPAKKKSSSKSRWRIESASFRGRLVFWISSRGERERSGTTVMPVCSETKSSASAAAGWDLAPGIQMNLVFGQVHARATFGDERLAMAQFGERGVELMPVTRRNPYARHAGFRESLQKFRETRQRPASSGNQVIDRAENDGIRRAQRGPPGWKGNCNENRTRKKKKRRKVFGLPPFRRSDSSRLAARLGGCGRRRGLRIHLWNAQVTADGV